MCLLMLLLQEENGLESLTGENQIQIALSKIDIDDTINRDTLEKDICIFFSFDLVGSTKFKTEENTKDIWPHVIFRFYELIYTELKDKIPQIIVWKYLGDEVLLYVSIQDFESESIIYSIPNITYITQVKVSKDIQNLFKMKTVDIKSTVWIAGVQTEKSKNFEPGKISNFNECYKNLKMSLPLGDQLHVDFLGPDMDTGFRVAKFAYHHKVVLSSDFAYLLYRMKKPKKQKSIDDQLRIVSFEVLKGVWSNKFYPIIWYYPNWKCIENDFFYADHKENEIVDRILSNRFESINVLEKVYEELDKTEYIDNFVEECIKINSSNKKNAFVMIDINK